MPILIFSPVQMIITHPLRGLKWHPYRKWSLEFIKNHISSTQDDFGPDDLTHILRYEKEPRAVMGVK